MLTRYSIRGSNDTLYISYDLVKWIEFDRLPIGSNSIEDQYNQWYKIAYPERKHYVKS